MNQKARILEDKIKNTDVKTIKVNFELIKN